MPWLDHRLLLDRNTPKLANWADMWQLTVNINKCAILSLSRKAQPILYAYYINGLAIPRQNCFVDLGVTVSSNLSFEQHINSTVSKARQRTSIIFRGFISRKLITMRAAFTTYIRPFLEYNSIIWNSIYINLIDFIENVQRQFTKGVSSISSISYSERLDLLDLDLLELGRLRFDLVYYYKVFNCLTPFTQMKYSVSSRHLNPPNPNRLTCLNLSTPPIVLCQVSFSGMLMRGTPCQPPCALHLPSQRSNVS
jgi:hypothetical protein